METARCAAHSHRVAQYQCDGCEKMLCPDCIEEGHRLLFCRHCGELAVPLNVEAPTTTPQLERQRKRDAPYSLRDALFYPFRGLGAYLYFGYVVLSILFKGIGWLPAGGFPALVLSLMILVLLPGLLFSIVRSSAQGDMELPDWPDWFDTRERLSEVLAVFLVGAISVLPLSLLLQVVGCGLEEYLENGWSAACWGAIALGVVLGFLVSVPAVGAVGVYGSGYFALRIDLHVRALLKTSPDSWHVIGLLAGLFVASQILKALFGFMPLLGSIIEISLGIYTMFLAMHLIGLHFRKYSQLLENLYL